MVPCQRPLAGLLGGSTGPRIVSEFAFFICISPDPWYTSYVMEKAIVTDRRAAKLHKRSEDYREITHWFRESFKPYAKAQHRRNRRQTREILKKDA